MPKRKRISEEERFGEVDDDFVKKMADAANNPNTKKSDEKCEKIFIKYLLSVKEENCEYWTWSVDKLNNTLSKFWFAARNVEGDYYRVSSLKHIRYALNRCLERQCHGYDIITSDAYKPSQKAFKDACTNLKKLGYGYVNNHPEISASGTVKFTLKRSSSFVYIFRSNVKFKNAKCSLAEMHVAPLFTFSPSQSHARTANDVINFPNIQHGDHFYHFSLNVSFVQIE